MFTPKEVAAGRMLAVIVAGVFITACLCLTSCSAPVHACATYGRNYKAKAVRATVHAQSNYKTRRASR